jgi:hypothetical protein
MDKNKIIHISKNTKLYQSGVFMKFLKKLYKSKDKHKVLVFFCILHNLIRISRTHDKEIHAKIVNDYKTLLSNAFSDWGEIYRYSYGKIKDILILLTYLVIYGVLYIGEEYKTQLLVVLLVMR